MSHSKQESFVERAASLLSDEELRKLLDVGMGQRVGYGDVPALLIVDAQNYEIGKTEPDDHTVYPEACQMAPAALPQIRSLMEAFRASARPVIYTRSVVRDDGHDMGVKRLKRGMLHGEGWCVEGTKGAEICPLLRPESSDVVLTKSKQSAFHGTHLLDLLIFRSVDTLIITGGSTSNCIRATAIDSASYNFRTIVPADAVFDRVSLSHSVNLMDIDRQLGDVTETQEVLDYLATLPPAERLSKPG